MSDITEQGIKCFPVILIKSNEGGKSVKRMFLWAAGGLMMLCLMGYSSVDKEDKNQSCTYESSICEDDYQEKIQEMTLRQKICQMFIVTPEALSGQGNIVSIGEDVKQSIEEYPAGGVIYFGKNIKTPAQTKELVKSMNQYIYDVEEIIPFACIDEEGGRIARIGRNSAFPVKNVKPMGDITSKEEAFDAGAYIGSYLHEYGFNLDFAPDADVLSNAQNSVIGDRSFGTDKNIVTRYACAFSDGLHTQNILSCYKHFPGHGATVGDTHEGYAYTDKTYDELLNNELVPFKSAGQALADSVMVSHIAVPKITNDTTPCSLSEYMITDVLRQDFSYDGLIITDAMNMGAIIQEYTSDEAAVLAIQAGVDIILMPQDYELAVKGVETAVENGTISEERINESVLRILRAKEKITLAD